MKGMLAVLTGFAVICAASWSFGQEVDNATCQQTIQSSCTSCHSTKRICHVLDKNNANWPNIIKEMGELGNLSQEVQDIALNCLTKATDPKEFVCH